MSFTPSRPHPRSHWKKLTQLALSYFIPLGGAQNLTKTVLIYGDCHQNCPSCGTGRCRPRRRMDSAHPATGGCASPRCGRRLSYFSDIVCLLLSNVCVVTSFYQSLQAMSSFALFSICASYCTLSAKGRHLGEQQLALRWRPFYTRLGLTLAQKQYKTKPTANKSGRLWYARQDSNLRPCESESHALSSCATGTYSL